MTRASPRAILFGGFHNDPGSRRQFLRELRSRNELREAPHFVGVEWGPRVFATFSAYRRLIADGLQGRWSFLGEDERADLSNSLAWEADAHRGIFPLAELLWLDDQPDREEDSGIAGIAYSRATELLTDFQAAGVDEGTPAPRSKEELIDQVRLRQKRRKDREGAGPIVGERDRRWSDEIRKRIERLPQEGGWIAIVVGWAHANPDVLGNLYQLLLSADLDVEAIYLGLPPGH